MKKHYIKPILTEYSVAPSTIMAGSIDVSGVSDVDYGGSTLDNDITIADVRETGLFDELNIFPFPIE